MWSEGIEIITTLFSYSKTELDKASELLAMEAAKNMVTIKAVWAQQEEAFQSAGIFSL